MSYVLQALKRAQEDRGPEEAVVARLPLRLPVAPAWRPLWPWLVGGGLVINALVIGAIFDVTRPSDPTVFAPPPAGIEKDEAPAVAKVPSVPAPTVQAPAAESQPSQEKPADVTIRLGTRDIDTKDAETVPPSTARAHPTPPSQAQPSAPEQAIAPEQPTPPVQPPLRRRRQPQPGAPASAPPRTYVDAEDSELKIDALVWAADPKQRVVYLNGVKYVEGQVLENGAVIEQIGKEGIVLVNQGRRIRVQTETR